MSGKAYTMREMKMIVDYLTEHRAYGELRGRKMWMDFASTNLTTRTWQSLKETFLKRILPDITNPYYKLTVQQIASFQQGSDIEAKINNKLEIRTVDENSNSSDSHNKDPQPSKPSNSKEVDASGEPNSTKVNQNRSSTDTAISEPCYKTAEDIRKDLESPKARRCDDSPTKSIRDYITYSEPLTPMLQEVLDDFGSDDEGDEPQMQIVEYPETNIRNDNLSPIEILDTENTENAEVGNEKNDSVDNNTKKETVFEGDSKISNRSDQDVLLDNVETECIDISDDAPSSNNSENQVNDITNKEDVVPDSRENNVEKNIPNQSQNQESQIQSNSTAVMLPNNQEAFKQLCDIDEKSANVPPPEQPSVQNSNTRKRSQSQDIQMERPKKRRSVDKVVTQSLSDGDTRTQKENNVPTPSKLSPNKSKTTLLLVKKVSSETDKKNNSVNTNVGDGENLHNNEILRSKSDNQGSSDESVNKRPKRRKKVSVLKDIEEDKTSVTSEEATQKDKETSSKETNRESSIRNDSATTYIKEVINDVVILKSQSETSSDNVVPPKKKKAAARASHKIYRDKALANVFGFSAGIGTKRKKQIKHRKRHSSHQQTIINTSGSSEWTSDTGSEYVSPPRGRKNKQTRKYLKPKPARVLSLEEEGGLFVMYGKKIYPVMKDGKIIKNYLTYTPENESEDEESYWKLKYVEEKKKTDELTKLLKKNDKREIVPVESSDCAVSKPITLERSSTSTDPSKESSEKNVELHNKDAAKTKEETNESKTLKIKFTKNNEEVQLEGHWAHIHPVLQQVVEILHKEPANEKPAPDNLMKERENNVQHTTESPNKMTTEKQKTARDPTSADVDIGVVREKIDKLEEEIFKEIEEREKSDSMLEDIPNSNVTKRRTLKQKKSTSAPVSPTKKRKLSNEDQKTSGADQKTLEKRKTLNVENNASIVTRQQSRTPKKILNDKEGNEKVINNTKKSTRKSTKNVVEEDDDSQIKYKFPSPPNPTAAKKLNKSSPKVNTNTRSKRSTDKDTIISSPENISCNSIESTQGYQDSDASTLTMCLRKKRKFSITNLSRAKSKTQRLFRRKTRSYVTEDLSSDSSHSFVTAPLKSSSHQNSSNTEIYRSESYQMLFPQKKQSIKPLEIIAEASPSINNIDRLNNNENGISKFAENSLNHLNDIKLSPAFDNDGENSSNVTLPPSPVLSIVENISISRNALSNSNDMPIDNAIEEGKQTMLNDFMFEDVDMSVPLMEQECGLEKSCDNPTDCHYNMNVSKPTQQISESFLNKICAVNIKEPTLSESINQKLRNLLLESAKKIANHIQGNNNNTESKMDLSEPNKQVKTRSKKRCSTPRKRQKKQNMKVASTEQLVIHEHTESFGSRISNPQPLLVVPNTIEDNNILSTEKGSSDNTKTRKKKDVIKVKIVKPRPKKKVQGSNDTLQIIGKTSLRADSGNNDTESGVFLQGGEDSIDLIHNHSDTCLHAHECVGNSVEIIDNNVSSVISLNSNSAPLNELKCTKSMVNIAENVLLDIFCENAQDGDSTVTEPQRTSGTTLNSSDANISAMNSLLTDDLSDESVQTQKRASKWYLLSEDESNTNYIDFGLKTPSSNEGCGANLHQIFPITCAVPDLSTITEENTAKFTVDRNTKSDIDSQSLSG